MKEEGIQITWVAVIYFALFLVAIWAHLEHPLFLFPPRDEKFQFNVVMDLVLGAGLGLGVAGSSFLAVRWVPSLRRLAVDFHQFLGKLSFEQIFFLSAFSSVSEEVFFRGFVQAKLGWVVTSLIFGLFHVGPGRKFLPWTFMATALGFAMGWLYEWRHDLFLPIAMHFTVNFVNLQLLERWGKPEPSS
jgi:membrane protease YdiL (CAAX protease family)